jgi:hypothetical protein
VPARVVATPPLRTRLTPFGEQVAAALGQGAWRAVSAAEAVDPFVTLVRVLGRESERRIRYADGSLGASWAEAPAAFIASWMNSESVALVSVNALVFIRRLADETAQIMCRLGTEPLPLRGFWEVGIDRIVDAGGAFITARLMETQATR